MLIPRQREGVHCQDDESAFRPFLWLPHLPAWRETQRFSLACRWLSHQGQALPLKERPAAVSLSTPATYTQLRGRSHFSCSSERLHSIIKLVFSAHLP